MGVVVAVLAAAFDEVLRGSHMRVSAGIGVACVVGFEEKLVIGHWFVFLIHGSVSDSQAPPASSDAGNSAWNVLKSSGDEPAS
jgi:hypothetical protein